VQPEVIRTVCLLLVVGAAAVSDLRSRVVPTWLTVGGGLIGLAMGAMSGWEAFITSLIGGLVGALLLVPFVKLGGMGAGDGLVLAAIGSLGGWPFVLVAAWWSALAGAVLAFIAWRRGQRSFAYVPALAAGAVVASL
jgi:prepilin peptidase CpaA